MEAAGAKLAEAREARNQKERTRKRTQAKRKPTPNVRAKIEDNTLIKNKERIAKFEALQGKK